MKKLLFALLLFASCNSGPEYQQAIKKYLKENLDDPGSYAPVSFGDLDSNHVFIDELPEYQMLKAHKDLQYKLGVDCMDRVKATDANSSQEIDDCMKASKIASDSLLHFIQRTPKFSVMGFVATHTFRAKNKMGALELQTKKFYFNRDKKLTKMGD